MDFQIHHGISETRFRRNPRSKATKRFMFAAYMANGVAPGSDDCLASDLPAPVFWVDRLGGLKQQGSGT